MKKSFNERDNSLKNCTRQDYIDSIVQKNDNSSNEEATEFEADDFLNEKDRCHLLTIVKLNTVIRKHLILGRMKFLQ